MMIPLLLSANIETPETGPSLFETQQYHARRGGAVRSISKCAFYFYQEKLAFGFTVGQNCREE
jgi:hypothetical protein